MVCNLIVHHGFLPVIFMGQKNFRYLRSTEHLYLRRFPYLLFWRETYPQNFSLDFLSISVQFLKKTFEKLIFCEGLYGENDGPPWARETYIQTIIKWEHMLNALQINQKNYTSSPFPLSNWRKFEDSGKVLARFCILILPKYWSSAL